MKIKFLGAAGTVTGSGYLVTNNSGGQLLVDLGMFQGPETLENLNYQPVQMEAKKLSGVILTHAHLDHCGRLPLLEKMGFEAQICMTAPTAELTELSLMDSAKIGAEDHPEKILYTREHVARLVSRFVIAEYDSEFTVGDFKIVLRDAGHILGSASVEIAVDGQKLVFSGDLGNTPEALVQPTKNIQTADMVVMESTYGDRLHPAGRPSEIIQNEINAVENSGGTLLIPAFSLERSQELLHIISHLKSLGKVAAGTPVILDSPMAEKATLIYEKYRNFLNSEIADDFARSDPFSFPGYLEIRKRRESQKIGKIAGAKVIIAGGGMMTGGRIVGHALNFLPKSSTRLLIVGYQGEGTLGRALLMGEKIVRIGQRQMEVSAHISDTQVMSSHADQRQLLSWLRVISGVKKVILTHGEDGPRQALAELVKADVKIDQVILPLLNQEIVL